MLQGQGDIYIGSRLETLFVTKLDSPMRLIRNVSNVGSTRTQSKHRNCTTLNVGTI